MTCNKCDNEFDPTKERGALFFIPKPGQQIVGVDDNFKFHVCPPCILVLCGQGHFGRAGFQIAKLREKR
jgi:hypothetical protein